MTTKTIKKNKVFYGWYIVAASIGMNFYLTMVFGLGFNVFFLPILREFGWTRALTSGAFSLRAVESGLLAPVVGFLVDRWGPRVVILVGVILGGAGMIMLGFINSLTSFYVAFLVASLGMTGAGHGVTWVAAVANWFKRLRGRALGMAMLGPVLGGPSVVVVAVLEGMIGWRDATILFGVGLWIVGIPLAMVARPRPEPYGYLPDGDTSEDASSPEAWAGGSGWDGAPAGIRWYRRADKGVLGNCGPVCPYVRWHQRPHGASNPSAGRPQLRLRPGGERAGMMFLLSGIGRIGSGILSDMLDYRLVLGVLIVFQMVGLLLLYTVGPGEFWLAVLFALVFGIGFGGTIPLRPILMMELFGPRHSGRSRGWCRWAP